MTSLFNVLLTPFSYELYLNADSDSLFISLLRRKVSNYFICVCLLSHHFLEQLNKYCNEKLIFSLKSLYCNIQSYTQLFELKQVQ
jgi:hypothetical protein